MVFVALMEIFKSHIAASSWPHCHFFLLWQTRMEKILSLVKPPYNRHLIFSIKRYSVLDKTVHFCVNCNYFLSVWLSDCSLVCNAIFCGLSCNTSCKLNLLSPIVTGYVYLLQRVQPHLISIDNMTLAVFEDSGWYRVNYQFASNFVWGRGNISRHNSIYICI